MSTPFVEKVVAWAMRDLRREVDSDFALMRWVRNNEVYRLMLRLDELPPSEQLRYMEILLLKRYQSQLLLQPPYSEIAEQVLADYESIYRTTGRDSWSAPRNLPIDPPNKVKRRKFIKALIANARPFLGKESFVFGGEYQFEQSIRGNVLVRTYAGGGNFHVFSYDQRIIGVDNEIPDRFRFFFPDWLGIRVGHWSYILEEELDQTVAAVTKMMEIFNQALPELLSDVPSPQST